MKRLLLLLIGLLACLALPHSAKASITLAQSCNVSTAAITSTTCTINTATLTNGSLLVCGMMWGNVIAGATYTISDPTNGTYTASSGTPLNDGTPSNSLYLAWIKNTSTAASLVVTFAVSGSGSHTIRAGCYEYTTTFGWPSSPVVTQSATASSSTGASGAAANVSPTATGQLIFSAIELVGNPNSSSFSVSGTGFTRQDAGGGAGNGWGGQTKAEGCDNQNSGNTATTCTFAWIGASSHWAAAEIVFAPNTGGATPIKHKTVQN